MKTPFRLCSFCSVLLFVNTAIEPIRAQVQPDSSWISAARHVLRPEQSGGNRWGCTVHFAQQWGSIREDGETGFFVKPSLGGGIGVDFAVREGLLLNAGVQMQQYGTGVRLDDVVGGIGNPDSTFRTRLRISGLGGYVGNAFASAPLCDGKFRMVGGWKFGMHHVVRARSVFHSVEDGFHEVTDLKSDVVPFFSTLGMSAGLEWNQPSAAKFSVQWVACASLGNAYRNDGVYAGRRAALWLTGVLFAFRY